MIVSALILIPAAAGAACLRLPSPLGRRATLLGVAILHLLLTLVLWTQWLQPRHGDGGGWFAVDVFALSLPGGHAPAPASTSGHASASWLALDAMGLVCLTLCSILFLAAAVYGFEYLKREKQEVVHHDFQEGVQFINESESVFASCLLFFLAAMTLTCVSHHLGLFWIAVEGTTLASAPLIYFHRHHRSLEATWKYLLLCSVGIALALLGNFFLAKSVPAAIRHETGLVLTPLLEHAPTLDPAWLLTAQIFLIVGYGTKVGLAPLHNWLPDVYSEAPSLVALLSGALANCVFLGILRGHQICTAAGLGAQSCNLLIGFGVASMAAAAVFMIGQQDFKRMLGYSSIEHMGILSLAVGVKAGYALGLHAACHSLAKAGLFLVAGNLLAAYQSKSTLVARGVNRTMPLQGFLWLCGLLAITGTPPFGAFLSEFSILQAILAQKSWWLAATFLGLLTVIFMAMAYSMLPMTSGSHPETIGGRKLDPEAHAPPLVSGMSLAPAVLLAGALLLGIYIPAPVNKVFEQSAACVQPKAAAVAAARTEAPGVVVKTSSAESFR